MAAQFPLRKPLPCFAGILFTFLLLAACSASPEQQAAQTAEAQTATAAVWTATHTATPSSTFTPSATPTITLTFTSTPTVTNTPTDTPTPTLTPTIAIPVSMGTSMPTPGVVISAENLADLRNTAIFSEHPFLNAALAPDKMHQATLTMTGILVEGFQTLYYIPMESTLGDLHFTLDSRLLYFSGDKLYFWRAADGSPLLQLENAPFRISPDSARLAYFYDDKVLLYSLEDGSLIEEVWPAGAEPSEFKPYAISADFSTLLLSNPKSSWVKIVKVGSTEEPFKFNVKFCNPNYRSYAISPGGAFVVESCTGEHTFFRTSDGSQFAKPVNTSYLNVISDQMIATFSSNTFETTLWEVRESDFGLLRRLSGYLYNFEEIASGVAVRLITCTQDGFNVYPLDSDQPIQQIKVPDTRNASLSTDGTILFQSWPRSWAEVRDGNNGNVLGTIPQNETWFSANRTKLAFLANAVWYESLYDQNTRLMQDLANGTFTQMPAHPQSPLYVEPPSQNGDFNPSPGRKYVSWNSQIFDPQSGRVVLDLDQQGKSLLAVSDSGELAAVAAQNDPRTVEIIHVADGKVQTILTAPKLDERFLNAFFTPDEQHLITNTYELPGDVPPCPLGDNTCHAKPGLRIWNVADGSLTGETKPGGVVMGISPDSSMLYLDDRGQNFYVIRIPDAVTLFAFTLPAYQYWWYQAAASPDGKWLYLCQPDGCKMYETVTFTPAPFRVNEANSRGGLQEIIYSPDSALIGEVYGRGIAILDRSSGETLQFLWPGGGLYSNGEASIQRAFFTPDGMTLNLLMTNGDLLRYAVAGP